jgi:hypothetical protein
MWAGLRTGDRRGRCGFGRRQCPIGWCCGWPLSELLQRKRGRVRCDLGAARRRRIGRQRGRHGPHNSGAANCAGRERVCRPGRYLLCLDRGADRGRSCLRAVEHRNGDRRPAGHQTADTEGKAGWKLCLQLSKQKAESRLRVNFGCRLLSAARPRHSAPREYPECRTATCFGPSRRGFLRQRPWPGMGGHRDNPAGIRRTRGALDAGSRERGVPETAAKRIIFHADYDDCDFLARVARLRMHFAAASRRAVRSDRADCSGLPRPGAVDRLSCALSDL